MPTTRGVSRPEARGLARARLLAQLGQPSDLTLIVAPAGSGKTTLLAQYAASRDGPTGWYRAEPDDSAPARLAQGLRAAVGAVSALPMATTDLTAESVDELAATLSRVAGLAAEPAALVVDDFHVVMETTAESAFERFLTRRPSDLRMLVASRRMPSFNLSRAELGTVTLVTADDLRFRSWEVERLFGEVYQEPLPPSDAAALTRRTEGWAASLQLFHLSTRGRPLGERRRAISALTRRSRYARSYLARTVLDELPDTLRRFLRLTCMFEVLTAERCDRLLDTTDAQRQLEDLERRQALTTSDDDGRTFRYHEVLRRHLESALVEDLGTAGARGWYAAAASLLEGEGALPEAVRGYALAERWPDAARLLCADGARVVGDGAGTAWPDLIPAKLIDEDPWLSLALARRWASEGGLAEAARRYRHAEQLFADPRDRDVAVRERRIVEVWAGRPAQPHLHWLDRLRVAVQRQPLAALVPLDHALPANALCRALAQLLAGDIDGSARLLRDLAPEPETGFPALATRFAAAIVAAVCAQDVRAATERLAADAERAGVLWVTRQCRALAPLLGQAAGTDRDGDGITQVVDECERTGDVWGALLARGLHALFRLLCGEPAAAEWADVAGRCRALDAGSLEAWARSFVSLCAACEKLPEAAAVAGRAQSFARSTGVPGAEGLAALAAITPPPAGKGPEPLADQYGMTWLRRLAERLPGAGGADAQPVRALADRPPLALIRERQLPMTLRCFGGFALELTDRTLDWPQLRPRAAATLRLLAMHAGRRVHREMLLAALWPDAQVTQATHNLQVAVSSLRRFLEPGAARGDARIVVRHGDTYALVPPDGSSVDVMTFATALRDAERAQHRRAPDAERAALQRAVGAYGGELLPEDGPAEWVVAERERSRVQAAAAAGDLATLELTHGEAAAGVAAARRSLEIDPFRDASWRVLITAYDLASDPAAAKRARQEYADVLETLGVPQRSAVSDRFTHPNSLRR